MNKDEYYSWIAENDTYPPHSHKFIVEFYTGEVYQFYRRFGTFDTRTEARKWSRNYREKYTTPGFISQIIITKMCEVIE